MTIGVLDVCPDVLPFQVVGNGEGGVGAKERPVDAVAGLEPGEGGCPIPIGISDGLRDGEGLTDCWSALNQEGSVAVIDVGNGARLGKDSFLKPIAIFVLNPGTDLSALQRCRDTNRFAGVGCCPDACS